MHITIVEMVKTLCTMWLVVFYFYASESTELASSKLEYNNNNIIIIKMQVPAEQIKHAKNNKSRQLHIITVQCAERG